jgi:hypothetical protein
MIQIINFGSNSFSDILSRLDLATKFRPVAVWPRHPLILLRFVLIFHWCYFALLLRWKNYMEKFLMRKILQNASDSFLQRFGDFRVSPLLKFCEIFFRMFGATKIFGDWSVKIFRTSFMEIISVASAMFFLGYMFLFYFR